MEYPHETQFPWTYADPSLVLYSITSSPVGFVTKKTEYLPAGSVVTPPSLHGAVNGYQFTYWTINGVRQEALTGIAQNQVSTTLSSGGYIRSPLRSGK